MEGKPTSSLFIRADSEAPDWRRDQTCLGRDGSLFRCLNLGPRRNDASSRRGTMPGRRPACSFRRDYATMPDQGGTDQGEQSRRTESCRSEEKKSELPSLMHNHDT